VPISPDVFTHRHIAIPQDVTHRRPPGLAVRDLPGTDQRAVSMAVAYACLPADVSGVAPILPARRRAQWHEALPESVKVLPASGMNRHAYDVA
jgi:hypothetical protein